MNKKQIQLTNMELRTNFELITNLFFGKHTYLICLAKILIDELQDCKGFFCS